jgi:hypothetical protein
MATMQDLFKSKEKEIYGTSDMVRIESKGLVNLPRAAALLASSPNSTADLIGNQIGGALGGTANRPDDTIFTGNGVFDKPVSLGKTQYDLQHAVQANTGYYIKPGPAPASILAKLKQGASSPLQLAKNTAVGTIQKVGLNKNSLKNLKKELLDKNITKQVYAPNFTPSQDGTPLTKDIVFSNYKPQWGEFKNNAKGQVAASSFYKIDSVKERTAEDYLWDNGADYILAKESFTTLDEFNNAVKKYRVANQIWVTFQKYGNNEIIPFVGSISGISEDIQTEWNSFKYIGSPFKTHRYSGVERSLKFDLKLYYYNSKERDIMIKKINYLKSLTFPYETISQMTYGNNTQTAQYAFSPNLVTVSIGDLYTGQFGYIESLGFNIEENITWPNEDINADGSKDSMLYPSVVNVSVNMKIIENQKIEQGTITKYKYNFDGLNSDGNYTIAESAKEQGPAQQSQAQLNALNGKGPITK